MGMNGGNFVMSGIITVLNVEYQYFLRNIPESLEAIPIDRPTAYLV